MRLVFFDLETGGLDPSRHPIIQIAACAVDEQLLALEWFEAKIAFDMNAADPEALLKNSYDREVWERHAQPEQFVCCQFAQFLKRHADVEMISQRTGRPYFVAQLIGHNADKFDFPFLQAWYKRLDKFLPAAFSVMCTYQRALHHFHEHPQLRRPENLKLESLAPYFGIELTKAHDALADVTANVRVYQAIRQHSLQSIS